MSAAEKILDRLTGGRQTGVNRWIARCPAHEDRSPSLSIRVLDDGRILLHCFAGCGAVDVVEALGLTLADLFEDRLPEHRYSATQARIPARDLLEIISEETSAVAIIAADMLSQKEISESDWQRLAKAASRIGAARDHIHGS